MVYKCLFKQYFFKVFLKIAAKSFSNYSFLIIYISIQSLNNITQLKDYKNTFC